MLGGIYRRHQDDIEAIFFEITLREVYQYLESTILLVKMMTMLFMNWENRLVYILQSIISLFCRWFHSRGNRITLMTISQ